MSKHSQRTDSHRYLIAYLLDDLPMGASFEPTVLHITILPWFALEAEEGPFIKWFYEHFDAIEAFDATAAQRAVFGPHKDVPVSILEPQDKFMNLHKIALSWFGAVGARWAERDPYVGDDYIPHIAQRRGYVINETEKFHISSVTLFKANRHEDQIRTVAAKAILHEPS
jgi:2'-5' RNA ligase